MIEGVPVGVCSFRSLNTQCHFLSAFKSEVTDRVVKVMTFQMLQKLAIFVCSSFFKGLFYFL